MSQRFRRSLADPLAPGARTDSNKSAKDYSTIPLDQLERDKAEAEKQLSGLASRVDQAKEKLRKVEEDGGPKKDYEYKKSEWKRLDKIYEDMKENQTKAEKAQKEFDAAKLIYEQAEEKVNATKTALAKAQFDLDAALQAQTIVLAYPQRKVAAESEQSGNSSALEGLKTKEEQSRLDRDGKLKAVNDLIKDINGFETYLNTNCAAIKKPYAEGSPCHVSAASKNEKEGELKAAKGLFNTSDSTWNVDNKKLTDCQDNLKNLESELLLINGYVDNPIRYNGLKSSKNFAVSETELVFNTTKNNLEKAISDMKEPKETYDSKKEAKRLADESAANAPIGLDDAKKKAGAARTDFLTAEFVWRKHHTKEKDLNDHLDQLTKKQIADGLRVAAMKSEIDKQKKRKRKMPGLGALPIAGIVAGVFILFALPASFIAYRLISRRIKAKQDAAKPSDSLEVVSNVTTPAGSNARACSATTPDSTTKIATSNVSTPNQANASIIEPTQSNLTTVSNIETTQSNNTTASLVETTQSNHTTAAPNGQNAQPPLPPLSQPKETAKRKPLPETTTVTAVDTTKYEFPKKQYDSILKLLKEGQTIVQYYNFIVTVKASKKFGELLYRVFGNGIATPCLDPKLLRISHIDNAKNHSTSKIAAPALPTTTPNDHAVFNTVQVYTGADESGHKTEAEAIEANNRQKRIQAELEKRVKKPRKRLASGSECMREVTCLEPDDENIRLSDYCSDSSDDESSNQEESFISLDDTPPAEPCDSSNEEEVTCIPPDDEPPSAPCDNQAEEPFISLDDAPPEEPCDYSNQEEVTCIPPDDEPPSAPCDNQAVTGSKLENVTPEWLFLDTIEKVKRMGFKEIKLFGTIPEVASLPQEIPNGEGEGNMANANKGRESAGKDDEPKDNNGKKKDRSDRSERSDKSKSSKSSKSSKRKARKKKKRDEDTPSSESKSTESERNKPEALHPNKHAVKNRSPVPKLRMDKIERKLRNVVRKLDVKIMSRQEKIEMIAKIKDKFKNKEKMKFKLREYVSLISEGTQLFSKETKFLTKTGTAFIIGDLHGELDNFHDILYKIIGGIDDIKDVTLIFLGDYVDRGKYSVELVMLLVALKCIYPTNVILLRGNHETYTINYRYGFRDELLDKEPKNGQRLYEFFNYMFAHMPLVCESVASKRLLCMHGGISRLVKRRSDYDDIPNRVPDTVENGISSNTTWSDPNIDKLGYPESTRGDVTEDYGLDVVEQQCKQLNVDLIVRAHQVPPSGVETCWRVVTVFSATSHDALKKRRNLAAILHHTDEGLGAKILFPGDKTDAEVREFIESGNHLTTLHGAAQGMIKEGVKLPKLFVARTGQAADQDAYDSDDTMCEGMFD